MKLLSTLALALALSSCTGSNNLGECIGIAEDGNPKLVYKISVRNTFWSFVGFETIIAPILWVTDYAKCPIGKRSPTTLNQGK